MLRRIFAMGEVLNGADVKSVAGYIGDLETTTFQYYIQSRTISRGYDMCWKALRWRYKMRRFVDETMVMIITQDIFMKRFRTTVH